MKVKYATEAFSTIVAAALKVYIIRFEAVRSSAIATSEFIDIMDKCCDLSNLSATNSSKKFNRAFKDFHYQQDFLEKCIKLFENLKVYYNKIEKINRIKCLTGFLITFFFLGTPNKKILYLWIFLKENT